MILVKSYESEDFGLASRDSVLFGKVVRLVFDFRLEFLGEIDQELDSILTIGIELEIFEEMGESGGC